MCWVSTYITESTDLEKVTVKSLDEIKREKQQRMNDTSRDTSTDAACDGNHDAVNQNDEVCASSSASAIDPGMNRTCTSEISKTNKCV